MSLHLRTYFLKVVAICFMIYGVVWALAPYPSINLPARLILDISDWPLNNYDEQITAQTAWLSSIGGGLLVAISVFLWGIVVPEIKRKELSILKTTQLAIILWYVVDSSGSVAAGVASNVFFNTIYLLLVMIPISCLSKEV